MLNNFESHYIFVCTNNLLLFIVAWNSLVTIYLFILSVEAFRWFQDLTNINKASIDICIQRNLLSFLLGKYKAVEWINIMSEVRYV